MTPPNPSPPNRALRSARRQLVLQHRLAVALAALLSFGAVVDFVLRASRNITDNDPAELQVLALAGGIPHGTSYPLYIWLVRLFAWVPLGPVALRLNVFSAVCGGLTLFAMAWICSLLHPRRSTEGWLAGAFVVVVMALSHTFTEIAIFTGMYTLHLAMACLGLGLFVRWVVRRRGRDLELALAVFGAMLANHVLTLALAPGVLVVLLWVLAVDRTQWRHALRGVGWALLAVLFCDVFLFYLLWRNHVSYDHWWGVVLRAPTFFEVSPAQAKSFWYAWWYEATCRQFRFDTAGASINQRFRQLGLVLPRLFAEVSPVVALCSVAGLVRLAVRRRFQLLALFLVVVTTHVVLATGYTATIKTHIYLLPVAVLATVLAGHGLFWPLQRARRQGRTAVVLMAAVGLTVLGLVLRHHTHALYSGSIANRTEAHYAPVIRATGPRPDSRHEHRPLDRAREIVDALPPTGLVLTDWDVIYAIQYVGRFERGTHALEIYDPYMYGRPTFYFVDDYLARILDPQRTEPVFFVGKTRPPASLRGFVLTERGHEVYELVRE